MSFDMPEFTAPIPIGGTRAWTARYDSYDQRKDDCYYMVTILEDGREVGRFMVQIPLTWAGDDWRGPGFVGRLRDELHEAAIAGHTNTTYRGRGV
jgi:hypothetical protein